MLAPEKLKLSVASYPVATFPYVSYAVKVNWSVAPAIGVELAAVIVIPVAVDGLTVTLRSLDVVIPDAVAEIDLGCDSFALYKTIGTLLATPLLNVTLVPVPKSVLFTVGSLPPIASDPLKVNVLLPV